ncbi:MAG: alpha/beta fold hydrolase [Lachnospiraceae bacterium]|nr:alpha/beta fold hydrolase [Lachnospiraceae bacterium]
MKTRNKLITGLSLTVGAIAGTALLNKYIKMTAVARNLLSDTHPKSFKWRLGNIHYTKTGTGKPLLLIHDLNHTSSGAEWEPLIPMLKEEYTIYTIDLLGCGRSEKPNLTYTNFLYVQLISDFIKSEIGRRTNIIATGGSASLVTMACAYNPDLFDQIMFINPESFNSCSQIPGKRAKIYKFILDAPVIGTLLYNIASSRDIIDRNFKEHYFYNPYEARLIYIDKYFESAHLGISPKAIYSSITCNYTKCNISRALEKINNSIYILGGGAKNGINEIINEYTLCNPSIESSIIAATKHLPQLEKTAEVSNIIKMFFN